MALPASLRPPAVAGCIGAAVILGAGPASADQPRPNGHNWQNP